MFGRDFLGLKDYGGREGPVPGEILVCHGEGAEIEKVELSPASLSRSEACLHEVTVFPITSTGVDAYERPEKTEPSDFSAGLFYNEQADRDSSERMKGMLRRRLRR
eukprot:216525-Hanusia_phi.AAC.1